MNKNILFNLLSSTINLLFPLLIFPYLTRTLGVQNYGFINYIQNIINYFLFFSSFGVAMYGLREISISRETIDIKNQKALEILFINIITSILAIIGFILLNFYFFKIKVSSLILVSFILKIFFNAFRTIWILQGNQEFKKITLLEVINKIIILLLIITFIKKPENYNIYIYIDNAMYIFNTICIFYFSKIKIKNTWNRTSIIQHFYSMFHITLMSFALQIYNNIDITMLGLLKGNAEVGIYVVSVKIKTIILMIVSSITTVMMTDIIKMIENNKNPNFLISDSLKKMLFFLLPLISLLFIYSKEIILIIAGKNYLDANLNFKLMSILMIFIFFTNVLLVQVLYPYKLEKKIILPRWLACIVNIFLNFILIKRNGVLGAGIATMVTEIAVFLVVYRLSKKIINLEINLKKMLFEYFISSIVIFSVVNFSLNNKSNYYDDKMKMFISLCISVSIYILYIFFKKDMIFLEISKKIRLIIKKESK